MLTPDNAPKVLKTLTEARALIADPARWTQGTYARNQAGEDVEWDAPSAVCFCSLGSLARVTNVEAEGVLWADHKLYEDVKLALVAWLRKQGITKSVSDYNDSVTHADVIKMFDGAIELVKEMYQC